MWEKDIKVWRGLSVNKAIKDEWLERLHSIPGVAVYEISDEANSPWFVFSFYPSRANMKTLSILQEASKAFSEVGQVQSDPEFERFGVANTEEYEADAWWRKTIGVLENFAARFDVEPPTIEDFERDILRGASEVFAYQQSTMPGGRYMHKRYIPSTPSAEKEAVRFLESLADLNRMSVYDIYLLNLDYLGGLNTPMMRWWFGMETALKSIGLQHYQAPGLADFEVPVRWTVAPGNFQVCVQKKAPYASDTMATVLLEHDETATTATFTLNDHGEGDFFGCRTRSFSSDERGKMEKYARANGDDLRCATLKGSDIAGFIAGLFPQWHTPQIVKATQRVLATCFARE